MHTGLSDNRVLIIAACAWAITQIIKVLVVLFQERRVAWNYFVTSGGMPSSHSATVCALATAIAMTAGVGSLYFSIAAVLAAIVMYDAAGVRQSVGKQSAVLNRIIREFTFKISKPEREEALREFIGHTPLQVIIGAFMGILIGYLGIIMIS
ncbi:MAG: divergent PAP2 family protein [Dehalococcoidales bacterium]|nr:divergent PAP2 family protein [Dehalococcoidales bacterium]